MLKAKLLVLSQARITKSHIKDKVDDKEHVL
jgi:hypothetical protein